MIEFRDATEPDLPRVVALLADDIHGRTREQVADPLPAAYVAAFRAMQAQGGRIILAVEADVIVGCLQFNVLHNVSQLGQSRAQIEAVRIDSTRRRQGIGAALMAFAIEQARQQGCGLVQLTTQADRDDARRFYGCLGFQDSHIGMKLRLG